MFLKLVSIDFFRVTVLVKQAQTIFLKSFSLFQYLNSDSREGAYKQLSNLAHKSSILNFHLQQIAMANFLPILSENVFGRVQLLINGSTISGK